MNTKDELKLKLEDLGFESDKIDEVANLVLDSSSAQTSSTGAGVDEQIVNLQGQMDNESDWRKRAAIAARVINLRLG